MRDDESEIRGLLLIEERDKAIMVEQNGNRMWIPRSEITCLVKEPLQPGDKFRRINITIPDWLADSKELE